MSTLIQNATENLAENQFETPAEPKIWTDAEFMALNRDGHRYEIVNGELIDMGNSGAKHCSWFYSAGCRLISKTCFLMNGRSAA